MKPTTFLVILVMILSMNISSCSNKEDKAEEKKERIKNTFTDYVDTGRETIDQSKELDEAAKKKNNEMEKMLDDM